MKPVLALGAPGSIATVFSGGLDVIHLSPG
jgi:hypothetical protein